MMRMMRRSAIAACLIFFAALNSGCLVFLPTGGGTRSPRFFENWEASYKVRVGFAHGTGVVLTEDGYILTAAHVVANEPYLDVMTQTGPKNWETRRAQVVAVDSRYDLAVIKAEGRFDRFAVLAGANDAKPGDIVYSIGYPYDLNEAVGRGYILNLHVNFEIAAEHRPVKNAVLLDMFAGPGASGEGIYAESDGKMIGMLVGFLKLEDPHEPPFLVRWATGVEDIRWFLQSRGIPFYE